MKNNQIKRVKRICASCRLRPARFRYRGRVKWDRHHNLCMRCFNSERERFAARVLLDSAATAAA